MASGCCAFPAVCIDAQTVADAACAAMPSDTAVSGTDQSQLMLESELNALLREYHDRFYLVHSDKGWHSAHVC